MIFYLCRVLRGETRNKRSLQKNNNTQKKNKEEEKNQGPPSETERKQGDAVLHRGGGLHRSAPFELFKHRQHCLRDSMLVGFAYETVRYREEETKLARYRAWENDTPLVEGGSTVGVATSLVH